MQADIGWHGRLLGVWAQHIAQEVVGARPDPRISGRFRVPALTTLRGRTRLRVPNSSQLTAQASRKLGALLPLDVQHTTSSGARWGFEAERVKLAWSTGIRKHTSAQRRQGSGAGTWLVGGFEFGYLLQCGGGGAGREACNVPLGWTTGSSSLLAGVPSPPGSNRWTRF